MKNVKTDNNYPDSNMYSIESSTWPQWRWINLKTEQWQQHLTCMKDSTYETAIFLKNHVNATMFKIDKKMYTIPSSNKKSSCKRRRVQDSRQTNRIIHCRPEEHKSMRVRCRRNFLLTNLSKKTKQEQIVMFTKDHNVQIKGAPTRLLMVTNDVTASSGVSRAGYQVKPNMTTEQNQNK